MIASFRAAVTRRGTLHDAASVGLGLGIVKAAGAIKIVFLARAFGASDALDAYLVAFLLPSFASEMVVGSFSNALIPVLISLRERRGRAAMEEVRGSLLAAVVVTLALVAAVLWIASPLVLRLMASDFNAGKFALTRGLFAWLLPALPMSGLSTVWRATLNAEERFTSAALAPVATPALTIIVLAIAGAGVSIWVLPVAHLSGLVIELLWLALALQRSGLGVMPRWSGWDSEMRTVILQHLPLLAVSAASNGGMLVDQSMAATLSAGSVSTLNYGTKLAAVAAGVVGGALSTAALPRFSKLAATEDGAGIRKALAQYWKIVLLAVVPGTLLLIALSGVLVRLVFQRGALTGEAANIVISVQRWSLLQLPPVVFSAILLRLISSFQINHVLMRVALMGLVLNAALDLLLKQHMGLSGIALSSSLVQLATAGYVLVLVRSRIPGSK